MSDTNGSLILKKQAELESAPFLFSEDELPKIDKSKPKFQCTGDRLFRDRPDVYKAVIRMLAEPGITVRMIIRECHVSDHTIRSVAAREKIPIATEKERLLVDLGHVQRLCVDRMTELLPEASLKDTTICFGVTTDKRELLRGGPTVRIECGQSQSIPDQLWALHRELVEKMKLAKAQAIETGVNEEDIAQKALMNNDEKQGRDADNREENGVIDLQAALIADDPEREVGKAI